MVTKPKTPDEAAAHFQAFLCAGIADLCRLVKLPDLAEFCPATRSPRRPSTAVLIPTSPAAAQLSLYLLLVTRGLQPKHAEIYPHRDRLRDLLRRVYRKALKAWDDGNLKDADGLQPGVRTLAKFARRNIPGFEHTVDGLEAFGVTSVERSLAILTEKLAMTFARKVAKNPAKAPAALVGASLVASAACPGVIESLGDDHTVRGLMRLGVRAGLSGASSGKAGSKSAALGDLRKFLKRADKFLDT
jgi:hypothetical protein